VSSGLSQESGGASDGNRLAAPLLALATRVLGEVRPAAAAGPLAAVRAFAADPSPARYLAAWRTLHAAARAHRLALLGGGLAGARFAQEGIDRLARATALPDELLSALRDLPADRRTGNRLSLLADLITVQELLAARASEALEALHQSLGPAWRVSASERRRRSRRPER
jgi:hypothetical protein